MDILASPIEIDVRNSIKTLGNFNKCKKEGHTKTSAWIDKKKCDVIGNFSDADDDINREHHDDIDREDNADIDMEHTDDMDMKDNDNIDIQINFDNLR